MVKYSAAQLDRTFAALSDPIRRAILARLRNGSASVTELAQPFRVSLPAISRHLRVLERARLVRRTREGRVHRVRLAAVPIGQAADWIEKYRRFWEGQLDSLDDYIHTLDKKKGRAK
jgi:DNA-binding transcriptional ArsR family regulator